MKIWITNFSCESVVLSEDTGLGACMEVTEANLFSLNSEINGNEIETMSLQSPVSLPCNVKLGNNLYVNQQKTLLDLFHRYKDVFAEKEEDHKTIETQD